MVKSYNRTDHLANERTFLAWIRTNLGIMAFGFVVERFSLFSQQVATIFNNPSLQSKGGLQDYSALFGIFLIAMGAILCVMAFFHFKKTEKYIDDDTYKSSMLLVGLLSGFVFLIGILLIIYIIFSPAVTANG